jgi:hypothetical protein
MVSGVSPRIDSPKVKLGCSSFTQLIVEIA